MAERVEVDYESLQMDGEDDPPDDLRSNVEGKKNCCMNREHVEDSFEANNHNISKVRSESRNKIVQSKTKVQAYQLKLDRPSAIPSIDLKTQVGRADGRSNLSR